MALLISLKRVFSFSARTQRIRIDHFPENLARTFLIGQDSILVYFSKFSFNVNGFIFNISNLKVTYLGFCNLLDMRIEYLKFVVTETKWISNPKLII